MLTCSHADKHARSHARTCMHEGPVEESCFKDNLSDGLNNQYSYAVYQMLALGDILDLLPSIVRPIALLLLG